MRMLGVTIAVLALCAPFARAQQAIDKWVEALSSDRAAQREEAMQQLRRLGPGTFQQVKKALHKKQRVETRRAAATLLAEFSTEMDSIDAHRSELLKAMRDEDSGVREQVAVALRRAGPKSVGGLVSLLGSRYPDARAAAAIALGRVGKPALERVGRLLDAKSAKIRAGALLALAEMGTTALPLSAQVEALASDSDSSVRAAVVRARAAMERDANKALPALYRALDDKDDAVSRAAAESLRRFTTEAWPQLLERLRKPGAAGTRATVRAVATLDPVILPQVEQAMARELPPVRAALLEALPELATDGLSPVGEKLLVVFASDRDTTVRRAAVDAIAALPTKREDVRHSALLLAAKDDDAGVREAAVSALVFGAKCHAECAPMLRERVKDKSAGVRAAAWYGLWRLRAPNRPTLAFLRKLLAEESSPTAARVLGRLGPIALPGVDDLVVAASSKDEAVVIASVRALGRILSSRVPGSPMLRQQRVAALDARVRARCTRAWKWLADAQEEGDTGALWSSGTHGGHIACDVGVTGLALLAYAAGGLGPDDERWGAVIRDGLDYLVSQQGKSGVIGPRTNSQWLLQHGIATAALCEALLQGASRDRYEAPARRALKFIRDARNPFLAWRYVPKGGENDTFISAWMAYTLKMGELAGLGRDAAAYAGVMNWLGKLTDPEFGQVGYNYAGGPPARMQRPGSLMTTALVLRGPKFDDAYNSAASQACTAAGLWTRRLLRGDTVLNHAENMKAIMLITSLLPKWEPEDYTIDLCYWRFAACGIGLGSRSSTLDQGAKKWLGRVNELLLSNQASNGSWDPKCVWGTQGGRVYMTSMAVLTLLGTEHLDAGLHSRSKLPKPYKAIETALKKASKSRSRTVAFAAQAALTAAAR
ncbi:MAG: HEAT repeat domain-containing protein [Planctomycetota bacterium]|jgi:HEAT repeat protein